MRARSGAGVSFARTQHAAQQKTPSSAARAVCTRAARGANLRLTEFQAALLLSQMTRLEQQAKTRDDNSQYLAKLLGEISGITVAKNYDGCTRSAHHLFMFRYHKEEFAGLPRAKFLSALAAEGIPHARGGTYVAMEGPQFSTLAESHLYRSWGASVIGMTNMPRMTSAKPWTNSDGGAASTLFAANNPPGQPNTNTKTMDHKAMLTALLKRHHGLKDDATDEEMATCCDSAMKKPIATNTLPLDLTLNGKTLKICVPQENGSAFLQGALEPEITLAVNTAVQPLETRIGALTQAETEAKTLATNAQAEAAKFRGLAINAHLDRAIDTSRITAAERADFEKEFAADFDGTLAKLAAKKTALNTKALEQLTPQNGADLSTPQGRKLAFNARTEELMQPDAKTGKRLSLDQAIAAMRSKPEDAAILKAMEEAK